jgi:hypothetical protein
MARKLAAGECLDVRKEGEPIAGSSSDFELRRFVNDVDYCDAELENWIWSIGRREADDRIFAATDGRYYQAEGFECLFLR